MKIQMLFLVCALAVTRLTQAASLYDCTSPRPEMAGFHNMVLFGQPDDQLYVYHLPLFTGSVNGSSGHVLMHVYQGLWRVQLDAQTKNAYDQKYANEKSLSNPYPFFSIGPKEKKFKVPEMICNPNFSLNAVAVYGHVEGNPDFPQPESLVNKLSQVTTQETILARRFDGTSKSALTYLLFGTNKQHYMVHFLTDDENSFDQIVGVEILDENLKSLAELNGGTLVSVPVTSENTLVAISENSGLSSSNNKWRLPTSPFGKTIDVKDDKSGVSGKVKIIGEIYFNNNDDLKK